jgi:hypothetical protein
MGPTLLESKEPLPAPGLAPLSPPPSSRPLLAATLLLPTSAYTFVYSVQRRVAVFLRRLEPSVLAVARSAVVNRRATCKRGPRPFHTLRRTLEKRWLQARGSRDSWKPRPAPQMRPGTISHARALCDDSAWLLQNSHKNVGARGPSRGLRR